MKRSQNSRRNGFTLVELLTIIVVVAILATIAIPNFQETIKNNQVTGQHNELVALINYARSEALRRSGPMTVSITESGNEWVVVVCQGVVACVPEDVEILREVLLTRVQLTEYSPFFSFNSRGYVRNPNSDTILNPTSISITLQHVTCTGPRQSRALLVRPTGQLTAGPDAGCSP